MPEYQTYTEETTPTDDDIILVLNAPGGTRQTRRMQMSTLRAFLALGGDLTGTTNNAQIAAGAVGTTELAADAVTEPKINATGTPSSTTALHGDMVWRAPSGAGGARIWVDHSTPTGGTETLDLSPTTGGNAHRLRLDADLTLSLSNIPAGRSEFWIEMYHDNTADDHTVTWFANGKFDGGNPPFLMQAANLIYTFECWVHNGGSQIVIHHGGTFS